MKYKIVGISGSPVHQGNSDLFLQKMLESVSDEDFETEQINLSGYDIRDCIHCNYCISKQKPEKYCSLNDDAQQIFDIVEKADIIVLASPVYFMRTSGRMASLIDRLRVFIFGNIAGGRLKNRIGVSAAVAWLRNGGVETTHLSHLYAFMTLEMIPVGAPHGCICQLGASAVASKHGAGAFDVSIRHGVNNDVDGLKSAQAIMNRAVELAKRLGKQ